MEQVKEKPLRSRKKRDKQKVENNAIQEKKIEINDCEASDEASKCMETNALIDDKEKLTSIEDDNVVNTIPKCESEVIDRIVPSTSHLSSSQIETINQLTIEAVKSFQQAKEIDVMYHNLHKELKELTVSQQTVEVIQPKVQIKAFTEKQLEALYRNSELEALEQFIKDFIDAETKGSAVKQHPLYELLISYLQVRNKLLCNTSEIVQLRRDCEEAQNSLWTLQSSVVQNRGQCSDGVTLTATHTFNKATFHRATFQNVQDMLTRIYKLIHENHVLYTYSSRMLQHQIQYYIDNIINTLVTMAKIKLNGPISLSMETPPPHILTILTNVRLCISILFKFQRKLIRDVEFIKESRAWLEMLVNALLRVASWQDHMFILNHVLRCPAGISSWAVSFIQTPLNVETSTPFANYEVNHILTVLSTILHPIVNREQFLQEVAQQLDSEIGVEALWVFVDSEGEEDEETSGTSLRENDLVTLLNQLPLDNLFRSVLFIGSRNDKDVLDVGKLNEHHILRFIAFSTRLLRILQTGLNTYNQPRYIQFCKRLCRFIRHVVQYVTDIWELFKAQSSNFDEAMMDRLQVEYDAFFLRSIYYLYTSEKLGAWQFLAVVPFGIVTTKTLWKIFYFLHEMDCLADNILDPLIDFDYQGKIWDVALRANFEDKLNTLADDECYYLLNTFANMALARKEDDMDFIQIVTMDLLQVGFVKESTSEMCCKNARILLTFITSKFPALLSDIIESVKNNMTEIKSLALYLYEELPISVWKLDSDDIEILSNWILKNDTTTDESKVARMILSRLNWGTAENGVLFLDYETHSKIALLLVKAVEFDEAYLSWAWQTAFRLRLHINDKGFKDFQNVKDIEFYSDVYKGVREQKPFHCFIAVLISSWGHLIPQICFKGLDQLILLQTHQKFEAVMFALNLIVPLFLECQESIINLDKFQNILLNMINADRSYINMAKSLVTPQNTILEQFGNMIESQIVNFDTYGLQSPRCVVRLWFNSIVSIPNWNHDYGVMHLLNVIIRASLFHNDTMEVVYASLRDLLQCATPQEQTNTISSLFKWVSQSNTQNNLLINTSLSAYPYLAFVLITLEFEEREKSTGLWHEILYQLRSQKGKGNVDAAIKKAASKLKVPSFASGSLCIFRWAQQALDTPIDHPILVLLWQKFFCLYLYQVPITHTSEKACVGEKFFEGLINFNFLKRLKKHLQDAVGYYNEKTTQKSFKHLASAKQLFYMLAEKVFNAYLLWLEEPRLQENSLHLPSLPPKYEPHLINLILQCNETPWMEYVDYEAIKELQVNCIKAWKTSIFRERKNVNQPLPNAGRRMESDDPWERISRRLFSYDTPKKAAAIKPFTSFYQNCNVTCKKSMMAEVDKYLKPIITSAYSYAVDLSEQIEYDDLYAQLIVKLYTSVATQFVKKVSCQTNNKTSHCLGAAYIVIEADEAKFNDQADKQIQLNRRSYKSLVSKLLDNSPDNLIKDSLHLQHVIDVLQELKHSDSAYNELGVDLYYYILSILDEVVMKFLPTKKLLSECLERLGRMHIYGAEFEMPRLLQYILDNPIHTSHLIPHFSPSHTGTANFISLYSTISKNLRKTDSQLHLVLKKFDVDYWLKQHNPKLSQRSQFIQIIMESLLHFGQKPPETTLHIHEVYRKHLVCIFLYQFPEHYGEILIHILKASHGTESDSIAISVWMDLLNALWKPNTFELKGNMREQLRNYAHQQQLLFYQELIETSALLCRHYTQERLQYGLYGLYPLAFDYIDVIALFLGMSGHSLIINALNTHQGILADKLCEIIWPYLRDMFMPWLIPYWTNNLKENMANWIQQLTDDRSVVLPWIPAKAHCAQKIVNVFFECILFILQTLPACNILSFVWQWYVGNFAHAAVKEHILSVMHASFIQLPWQKFWPSITDLEFMLKIVEQYLPECHTFLAHIFMEIPWPLWLSRLPEGIAPAMRTRIHHCLLFLLVKLSNEPNIKSNCEDKIKSLYVQMEYLDWSSIEANSVRQIMDWYVMSCDPLVIFKTDPLDYDYRILQFLRNVCFYAKPLTSPDAIIQEKRHIFIRTYMKVISVFINRNKTIGPIKEAEFNNLVQNQLNYMDMVVKLPDEHKVITNEILGILNHSALKSNCLNCIQEWIGGKEGDHLIVKSILEVLGVSVIEADAAAVLYEVCINTYFENNVNNMEYLSWNEIISYIKSVYPKQSNLIDALINKDGILTLHALLLIKTSASDDYRSLINLNLQWLNDIKINPNNDCKIPLLWNDFLKLCLKYCVNDAPSARIYLHRFAQHLQQLSEQKEGSKWGGFLGAIGINKQNSDTLPFRFLCRSLAGYILAQLPDAKNSTQVIRLSANAPHAVGQPGGNTEVVKILLKLDFGQVQGKIKECAESALQNIQNAQNSLHNVLDFLSEVLMQFYTKNYLKDIKND